MYEMSGDSYQNAKLISVDFGDMAVIQWFVNTGGQGQFGSEEDKTFVTTADGNKLEIFPNTENLSLANGVQPENATSSLGTAPFPWIFVVIFLIIPILLLIGLLVGIFYFFWHFKNRPKIYMIGVSVLVFFGLSTTVFAFKLNWRNNYDVRISTCDEHGVTGNILTDGNSGKKVSLKFPIFPKQFGEGVEVQTINMITNEWSDESPTTVCSVLSKHQDAWLTTNGLGTITLVKFFDDETLENKTSDENTVYEGNLEYSIGEDINNDGVIEDMKLYSEKPPADGLTTLYVNQEKIVVPGHNPEGTIKIIDLDTTDSLKEIAVGDLGPSGDPTTSFYDYDGKEILFLGTVPDVPSDMIFDGQGSITLTKRANILDTWFYRVNYQLQKNRTIVKVPKDFYERISPTDPITVLQTFNLQTSPTDTTISVVLKKGDVVSVVGCDDVEWCEVKTADGKLGWFSLENFSTIKGTELQVSEFFSGLSNAD